MKKPALFTRETIPFLEKAGRQRHPEWLERNRETYERVLQKPLAHLAQVLKTEIGPLAPDYHFPLKGIGRLKRGAARAARGGSLFKDWMTYQASRPRTSRFEHNPNLFFLINPEDSDDPVLVAGGLYLPSSKQVRLIREAIARDATPFEQLFRSASFSRHFKGGFSDERISSRIPRGYDAAHPKMDWIRLQAFFVWRPYGLKEFYAPDFAQKVAGD